MEARLISWFDADPLAGKFDCQACRIDARQHPGRLRLEPDYLSSLLDNEIIKRELIDSDEGGDASAYIKKLQRAFNKERAVGAIPMANPTTAPRPATGGL
jgi:hypothetical protein